MPEITRRFTDEDLTAEWRKNNNWQVVFKIKNNDGVIRDYCRETRRRDWFTLEETEQWATQQCLQHKLHGAEIQLF
jgi:hypothetical protein